MDKSAKIYIAGNRGMVGSAIERNLRFKGYNNFVFTPSQKYDLRRETIVEEFFSKENPDVVFLAAAKVGGIVANNTYRAEFIYDNLQIQNNIIHLSYVNNVKKLIFLGSSCIYPKNSPQPMKEDYLLTSELEYTNEPYAIAKIAGIKMIESYNLQYGTNFLAVMPTNLYGLNDNFDLEKSHVLPALIRKFHLANALFADEFEKVRYDLNKRPINDINGDSTKNEIIRVLESFGITKEKVVLWGSGNPKREFLHADDLADACVFLAQNINFSDILRDSYNIKDPLFPCTQKEIRNTHINIGTGKDQSIKELAEIIKDQVVGYNGIIEWDKSKPDGTFQKLLDVSKLREFGWKDRVILLQGIKSVYKNYCL